ncbi:hypothetical protein EV368DRAFT_67119, partial [Lentinula lateritia]
HCLNYKTGAIKCRKSHAPGIMGSVAMNQMTNKFVAYTGKSFQLYCLGSLELIKTFRAETPVVLFPKCVVFGETENIVVGGTDCSCALVYDVGSEEVLQTLSYPCGGLVQPVSDQLLNSQRMLSFEKCIPAEEDPAQLKTAIPNCEPPIQDTVLIGFYLRKKIWKWVWTLGALVFLTFIGYYILSNIYQVSSRFDGESFKPQPNTYWHRKPKDKAGGTYRAKLPGNGAGKHRGDSTTVITKGVIKIAIKLDSARCGTQIMTQEYKSSNPAMQTESSWDLLEIDRKELQVDEQCYKNLLTWDLKKLGEQNEQNAHQHSSNSQSVSNTNPRPDTTISPIRMAFSPASYSNLRKKIPEPFPPYLALDYEEPILLPATPPRASSSIRPLVGTPGANTSTHEVYIVDSDTDDGDEPVFLSMELPADLKPKGELQASIDSANHPKDAKALIQTLEDAEEERNNCPYCLGVMMQPFILSCGHTFCKECLLRLSAIYYEARVVSPLIPNYAIQQSVNNMLKRQGTSTPTCQVLQWLHAFQAQPMSFPFSRCNGTYPVTAPIFAPAPFPIPVNDD